MGKLLALALVPGLLLFGCAASPQPAPVAQEKQAQTAPAQCRVTPQYLRENMAKEQGVKQRGDLEGEPLTALVGFLEGKVDVSMPRQADRALLFEKGGVVLIVWFKNGCAIGHTTGPWDAINKALGTPI